MGRRRSLLIIVTLLVLAGTLLVMVPLVLAPLASERLSQALGVPVRVGRISLSALGPGITAYGVTIRAAVREPSMIALGTIHVDLALRRLLRGELALDALTLDQPYLALQRTATGDLNLSRLLPPTPEGPSSHASGLEERDTTPVRIDALRVRNGTLQFRDETTTPPVTTTIHVDSAYADDLRLTLGGDASISLRIASRIGGDAFALDLTYEAAGTDSTLAARLRTDDASLASALVHTGLDWKHVAGTVTAEVAYDRTVTDGVLTSHRVTVDATARDLALANGTADEVTFRAATATLSDLIVDFSKRRLDLGAISADDVWTLAYQDEAGLHLPFVAPADDNAPKSAWRTELGTVRLGSGTLVARDLPPGSPDLPIAIRSGRIAGDGDAVTFVFDTEVGNGTIGIDGRTTSDATTVKLTIEALDLPSVVSHLGIPIAFASGKLGGTLEGVFAGGPAQFTGRLVATDVKSTPTDAHPEEVFAWATLEVELAPTTFAPPRIHATSAKLDWPYLMLHRRHDGVYPFTGMATPPAKPSDTSAPPPSASDGPILTLDRGTISNGRIELYDTVRAPAYGADILDLEGTLQTLRVAPLTVERLSLKGAIDEISPVSARGDITTAGIDTELDVDRLRLAPLSPYIEPGIGYDITAGSASISTRLRRRQSLITADNEVEISRLKMRPSGPDLFASELGVPLSVALSLMKDSRGNLELNLPLEANLTTQEYRVKASLIAALREAFLGALQSPVRLLASVLLGDNGETFDLKPVPFAAGSAELGNDGAKRVDELARLLVHNAGLHLVLLPYTCAADAEALTAANGATPGGLTPRALATTRGETIRRALHEAYDIADERVRARAPDTRRDEDVAPGVDVQLRGD